MTHKGAAAPIMGWGVATARLVLCRVRVLADRNTWARRNRRGFSRARVLRVVQTGYTWHARLGDQSLQQQNQN